MSENNGTTDGKPDLVALRAEIQRTRADLGETVQALAAKADVKARAREQVTQTRQRLLEQAAFATGRLREVAGHATANVKDAAGQTASASEGAAHDVAVRVREGRVPMVLIAAGVAAVVGVILIVRGRR
ncbi:DUF3618 domain-containing protein [Actinoplanes sp. NPDC020271]|uniref:DUF3618 domain-containing protein n=1 Tax=Actinoplanes sp. NPDC020271 TaxID=3363896 RepID=UPI0037927B7D